MRGVVACFAALLLVACSSIPPHPGVSTREDTFSAEMAEAHVENLRGLGPRVADGEADELARAYLERELGLAGASVQVLEIGGYRHLVGEIEGSSDDSLLLVAPYSTLGSDDWVDDSGAALLLELARVLGGSSTPPYTVKIVLAHTRTEPSVTEAPGAGAGSAASLGSLEARQRVSEAGDSLASALEASGQLVGVRAVIAFEPRTGRPPRMARDLRSHPVFRAVFWDAAAELGYSASFPPDAGWRSSLGLQEAFQARGVSQVLALVDETTARAELQAELGTGGETSRGASSGLEPVGEVTLEALARLMRRFERVDAFSQ